MENKNILASPIPVIKDISQNQTAAGQGAAIKKWNNLLEKVRSLLKGKEEKASEPDPALPIIAAIADRQVAEIVKELHYRTPKSLQAMRQACESCFVLPDDCAYYDYSIFDVKKAFKRFGVHPEQTQQQVVEELRKINQELAHHLSEYLDD